jgi:hypothetical protein
LIVITIEIVSTVIEVGKGVEILFQVAYNKERSQFHTSNDSKLAHILLIH